jgi:4-amino-4-deoxy-L-arabinose transferase-like glycosyltransferase
MATIARTPGSNSLWHGVLFCLVAATVLLIYGNKARVPFFRANMLREAQTASVVQDYLDNGIHLLESKLAFMLPQPSYLLLEFPIYQAMVASAAGIVGYETFGKLLSVFSFIGSMAFVYLIAGRVLRNARAGVLAAAVMAVMPMNIVMQAAFMIDALALCLSLGMLYFGLRWNDSQHHRDLLAATILGALAAVIKPFVLFPLVFPLVFVVAQSVFIQKERSLIRSSAALSAMALTWVIALGAWYFWSDHLNRQGALFGAGNANVLGPQFIGGLASRIAPEYWAMMAQTFIKRMAPPPFWLWYGLAAAGFVACLWRPVSRESAFFFGALLGYLALLMMFFVAVSTHFYYSLPLLPILALLIGSAIERVLGFLSGRRAFPAFVGVAAAAILSAAVIAASWKLLNMSWPALASDWSYQNFDAASFVIVCALAVFFALALTYYSCKGSLLLRDIASSSIAVGLIALYLPSHVLPDDERFWKIPFPVHWIMNAKLVDQLDFVRRNLPPDRRIAVVSWRKNLYTEFMHMSGGRGQPIGFPSAEDDLGPGCIVGVWAQRMDSSCINYLSGLGIKDYFVVFITSDLDPPVPEVMKRADARKLVLINTFTPVGSPTPTVLHYRVAN